MTNRLKDLFEVYRPKAKDEADFVDKHVTIKHKDRNGNGDDVFQAKNIKKSERKKERHGYEPGEDEKVYEGYHVMRNGQSISYHQDKESAEKHARTSNMRGGSNATVVKDDRSVKEDLTGNQHKIDANKNGKVDAHDFKLLRGKKKVAEEVGPLDEGMMKLSKVHIVHHHDHPAAKEFAKNYTMAMKGDHKETGPNDADHKAAVSFHKRYTYHTTRTGFAGSGTKIYNDLKTGANWKVDRHPNGKTFYGTDHIISHVTDDNMREGVEIEYYFTEDQDRIIRSLAAAADEFGTELSLETLVGLSEEVLDEAINFKSLDAITKGHEGKSYTDTFNAHGSSIHNKIRAVRKEYQDNPGTTKHARFLHSRMLSAYASWYKNKKAVSEEAEGLDEASKPGYFRVSIPHKATTYHNAEHAEHARELAQKSYDNPAAEVQARRDRDPSHKSLDFSKASVRRLGDKVDLKSKFSKEEVETIDELSVKKLDQYRTRARQDIIDADDNDDNRMANKRAGGYMSASRQIAKKLAKEEVEQVDEISKATMGRYINKAKDSIDTASYRQGNREALGGSSRPLERKLSKRHKGISTAVSKLTKEESEQIDELSKATLGSYVKKASQNAADSTHDELLYTKSHDNEIAADYGRKAKNRLTGISKAADKLTKEELELIEAWHVKLNGRKVSKHFDTEDKAKKFADYGSDTQKGKWSIHKSMVTNEELEQIDELSKKTLNSYVIKSLVPSSEKSISNLASKGGYKLGQAHDDDYTAGEKEDAKSVKRSLGVLSAVRKLSKEDVINRAIDKYIPEEIELTSLEERLVNRLDSLQVDEQHIHILLSMFEGLNEQNKTKMLDTASSTVGVNSLLDFAISNKGTN